MHPLIVSKNNPRRMDAKGSTGHRRLSDILGDRNKTHGVSSLGKTPTRKRDGCGDAVVVITEAGLHFLLTSPLPPRFLLLCITFMLPDSAHRNRNHVLPPISNVSCHAHWPAPSRQGGQASASAVWLSFGLVQHIAASSCSVFFHVQKALGYAMV